MTPATHPTVAVLGLGEAGSRLASDLLGAGARVRAYDPLPVPTPDGVVRASEATAAVEGCDVVLGVTAAEAALGAFEDASASLRAGAVYADLNTARPSLKSELAALVAAAGGRFADVALLGPVSRRGLGTPTLASGVGARAFAEALGPLGMPVEVVSDRPGDAASLKLLRSVFMKGLAASVLESLRAAEAAGRADWLEDQIADVIGRPLLERLVEGSRAHAARRAHEMEAARDLELELGVEPRVAAASMELLAELATSRAGS